MIARLLSTLLLVVGVHTACSAAPPVPLYSDLASSDELRFGGTIGSGRQWAPHTPQASASVGFGGRTALTCSGLDYSGFVRSFDASAFLNDMKNQLLGGAQAAVATYLITLAYSNPTFASVMDLMNQSYHEKFSMFQTQCDAQEARRRGMEAGARRMAEAQNQCYEREVNNGSSPSDAYQTCANEATLGPIAAALPAGKSMIDFLKQYTNMNVTTEVEKLLGLLPDERVSASGHEVRPPLISLYQFERNIESRSANALNLILVDRAPVSIPDCAPNDYFSAPGSPNDACLPPTVVNVVQSPAFLAARQLSPEARKLYVDALSGQISIAAIEGSILDVMSQIRKMDVKPGAGAQGQEVQERKRALEEQVGLLQREVAALRDLQAAKADLVRTQLLAMDAVNQHLTRVEQTKPPKRGTNLTLDTFKALFGSN